MDEKKTHILTTTFDLCMRHGYSKVTMSDIAIALKVSRPTLYSSFASKEAILAALFYRSTEGYKVESAKRLANKKGLDKKLECVFDIWVLEPFISVIDSANGKDILANGAHYAPVAFAQMYQQFEDQLVGVIQPELKKKREHSARDIAHILTMATKGLKASSDNIIDLKRMISGLIFMITEMVSAQNR